MTTLLLQKSSNRKKLSPSLIMQNNKKFVQVLTLYTAYLWFTSFSSAILPTHFLQQGLNYNQMIFGKFLVFAFQLILLLFLTSFTSKNAWRMATVTYLMFVLLSVKILGPVQFYIASGLSGFSLFFFYIAYNIAHFKNTHKSKTGHSSAIMFSIGPIINIIAPLASGLIAKINFNLLWILAIVSFFICLFSVRNQENFRVKYSAKKALQEIKATRFFILIEGIWEALPFGLVPIFTLYFIKEPLPYGAYLAYLSLIAVFANLLLGKITDKIQRRAIFLYPITITLAVITFLFFFAINNLPMWIITTSLLQFFLPLFWNLSTAMVIDSHSNLNLAIPGRDLILGIGRIAGLFITFASLTFEKTPKNIFIFLGLVMLLFPIILLWNTRVSKRYSYL